jgi:UDP-glucose 4-epimerase
MRIVVLGATGNVGSSLLRSLETESAVDEVIAVARRVPNKAVPKTSWVSADITTSDLVSLFRGADAVVHLAWSIQPSRDIESLYQTNVLGSLRVFRAAAEAKVPALVYASSVGAYSPGPKELVDESWPTEGIETSFYSRHKAEVEGILNGFEDAYENLRVVRLRPALTFKKESAAEQRRLFIGPFLPGMLMRRSFIPVVPDLPRLRFQAVHSYDVGDAYRRAIVSDVRGPFNIAAGPILDPEELAEMFGARRIRLSERMVRAATKLTWKMHLQPTPPGWVDMGFESPLMDSSRARKELDWVPQRSSKQALFDLLEGLREGSGDATPVLHADAGGPARLREFTTGLGRK